MLKIIVSRLLQGIVVLFVLFTLTFFLVRALPGNPYTSDKKVPEHIEAQLKAKYGFDQPLYVQYGNTLKNALVGDFGPSFKRKNRQASEIIAQSFPVSLSLGLVAMFLAILVGIPAGVLAAVKRNSPADFMAMLLAMVGICVPTFVIGPILASWLGLNLSFLSVAGWVRPTDIILPSITLAAPVAAYIARLTRSGMLDVLSSDFIRTAKAKGVPMGRILWRHTLRGGLVPVVAYLGPAFAGIISGSFVVETIFQIPGMGQFFVTAPGDRDYGLLLGLVVLFGTLIVIANLAVDLIQLWLVPQTRSKNS